MRAGGAVVRSLSRLSPAADTGGSAGLAQMQQCRPYLSLVLQRQHHKLVRLGLLLPPLSLTEDFREFLHHLLLPSTLKVHTVDHHGSQGHNSGAGHLDAVDWRLQHAPHQISGPSPRRVADDLADLPFRISNASETVKARSRCCSSSPSCKRECPPEPAISSPTDRNQCTDVYRRDGLLVGRGMLLHRSPSDPARVLPPARPGRRQSRAQAAGGQ